MNAPRTGLTEDLLLTVREAAARLRVCERTIRNLINRGALESINISSGDQRRIPRIPVSALEAFLRERRERA